MRKTAYAPPISAPKLKLCQINKKTHPRAFLETILPPMCVLLTKVLIPELSWKPFSGRGLQIGCLTHPRAFLETMPQTMAKCMTKSHIATLMSPIFHSTNPCAESELYPIATQTPCCVTQHVKSLQKFIMSSDILFIDWTIRENSNSETK